MPYPVHRAPIRRWSPHPDRRDAVADSAQEHSLPLHNLGRCNAGLAGKVTVGMAAAPEACRHLYPHAHTLGSYDLGSLSSLSAETVPSHRQDRSPQAQPRTPAPATAQAPEAQRTNHPSPSRRSGRSADLRQPLVSRSRTLHKRPRWRGVTARILSATVDRGGAALSSSQSPCPSACEA